MIFIHRIIPELLLSLGLLFMVSCSDSSTGSDTKKLDQPPQIPAAKSMSMDLSIFNSDQEDSDNVQKGEHYEYANSTISEMAALQDRNIDLVVDLLAKADTADAVELENGGWEWMYSNENATENGRSLNYTVRLLANWEDDDEVRWDIFFMALPQNKGQIQNKSPVQNQGQRIISGTTNAEVTEGEWTYYSPARLSQSQQEIAELDWEIDSDGNVDMELELLVGDFSGSEMNYNTKGAVRTIILNSSDGSGDTTIKFNADTHEGSVQSSDYNNGKKACWDSNFEDANCSEVNL